MLQSHLTYRNRIQRHRTQSRIDLYVEHVSSLSGHVEELQCYEQLVHRVPPSRSDRHLLR